MDMRIITSAALTAFARHLQSRERSAGTIENGTVRLSFSPFNSSADADRAAAQLRASVKSLLDD